MPGLISSEKQSCDIQSARHEKTRSKLSVLVLDDETEVRETLGAMISSLGVPVECASTAEEFFTKLDTHNYNVLVLDLIMPDCDGLDVLSRVSALNDVQVILCSGSGKRVLDTVSLSAQTQGVNVLGVLPKPARRKALQELLQAAKKSIEPCCEEKPAEARPKITKSMLSAAIEAREIICHMQPKIRLCDGVTYGFEALARWHHPKYGMIYPDEFIPLASANGLDYSLSLMILDQAMECLASLANTALSVAVNVPMKVCGDPRFEPALDDLLNYHGLMPRHVILEITEAGPSGITQQALDALMRLRMKGHFLSIDDFGTGASSLERLVRIPFDELKIDRLFMRDIDKSRTARGLVRNLVQMAKSLGMKVTVEGVETREAIQISKKLGCDNAQGYGVARPMSPKAVREWMADHKRREISYIM